MCRGAGGGGAARAHCWWLSWMLAQAASVVSRYAFGADRPRLGREAWRATDGGAARTARPAAVSRAELPALRPGLTGTRRRKRRRRPSARRSTRVARRYETCRPDNPFARRAAAPDGHPTQRRRRAN